MSDKVALVTGGTSGIGKATAIRLIKDGYRVVVADVKPLLTGEDYRSEETKPAAGHLYYEALDVRDEQQISELLLRWETSYGRLDVLVNNAAIAIAHPITEMNGKDWDDVMSVNLRSAFLISKHALPYLKTTKGVVINVASVMGVYIFANNAAYSAAKAGMIHLTKTLAMEWLHYGIRVNAISPATVDTPLLRTASRANRDELEERIQQGIRSGAIQTPSQIANVISLFLRPEAAILTGNCIVADGGSQLMRH